MNGASSSPNSTISVTLGGDDIGNGADDFNTVLAARDDGGEFAIEWSLTSGENSLRGEIFSIG